MAVIFVDTETLGLDPDRHVVWDIALIEEDGTEHEWHIRPTPDQLRSADPGALRITRFYERVGAAGTGPLREAPRMGELFWTEKRPDVIAYEVAHLTANRHLVGACPWFDASFLERFVREQGGMPAWHYYHVDVEAMAAGRLGLTPPWDSHDISDRLGITSDPLVKHTAIGDARWAKQVYEQTLAHTGRLVGE